MWFLHNVWLIPLLPAVSFALILFFGKRMPKKGAEFGIAAVGLSFVLALGTGVQWIQHVNDAGHHTDAVAAATGGHGDEASSAGEADDHGAEASSSSDEHSDEAAAEAGEGGGAEHAAEEEHAQVEPITRSTTWWSSGGFKFDVGFMVDGLAVMMLFVVTLVSLLVHIYSTDYVHGDRRYTHFFAFLSLFTASMLLLVISDNTVQLITSWELVGLCSFALIGHWWEEKPNSDAALKAFLVNRVGDIGLLVGMIVLYFGAKSFNIIDIGVAANAGDISHLVLLVASCSLIAAVMSKSGQFILHVWLPDAMAGPTPVSALIHAATMVVAGVFMVARLYAVFFNGLSIGSSNINLLAVVGAVTVVFGALLAFVQNDIKKVLAYSTVSQLGYMVMALGVGAWTAAVFHLFTHAFFKACLFLGSGSVSHAIHSFDMKKDMGGMRKYMPKTFWTFVIATAALAGIFPLAGFWSKDEILAGASQLGGGSNGYPLMLVMGFVGAMMTAAYMTRCIYLTFFGEPRGKAAHHIDHLHESGPRIVWPLIILSGLAVVAGFANFPFGGESIKLRFEHYVEPVAAYFPSAAQGFHHPEFSFALAIGSTLVALLAIGLAYSWYFLNKGPHGITQRNGVARAGYTLLENKYYLDVLYVDLIAGSVKGPVARAAYWINQNVIDGLVNGAGVVTRIVANWTYRNVDQAAIDGIVNGSGMTAEGSGQLLRRLQTGKIQQYGVLLFGGAVILAGVFVFAI